MFGYLSEGEAVSVKVRIQKRELEKGCGTLRAEVKRLRENAEMHCEERKELAAEVHRLQTVFGVTTVDLVASEKEAERLWGREMELQGAGQLVAAELAALRKEIEDAPWVYSRAPLRLRPLSELDDRLASSSAGESCMWAIDCLETDTARAKLVRIEEIR